MQEQRTDLDIVIQDINDLQTQYKIITNFSKRKLSTPLKETLKQLLANIEQHNVDVVCGKQLDMNYLIYDLCLIQQLQIDNQTYDDKTIYISLLGFYNNLVTSENKIYNQYYYIVNELIIKIFQNNFDVLLQQINDKCILEQIITQFIANISYYTVNNEDNDQYTKDDNTIQMSKFYQQYLNLFILLITNLNDNQQFQQKIQSIIIQILQIQFNINDLTLEIDIYQQQQKLPINYKEKIYEFLKTAQKLSNQFLKELMQQDIIDKKTLRTQLIDQYINKKEGTFQITLQINIKQAEQNITTIQTETLQIQSSDSEIGLKFIESIEKTQLIDPQILNSVQFSKDLMIQLQQNNKLAIYMFNKVILHLNNLPSLPILSSLITVYQTFLDLYLTLDCYGSHLIKQLWNNLEILFVFQESQLSGLTGIPTLINVQQLIKILFDKFARHSNYSVTKYCAKQFLKMKQISCVSQYMPLLVSSLIDILNLPMFYKDADFEKDSKVAPLVISYYSHVFSQLSQDQASLYLYQYLSRVIEHSSFVHSIVTFTSLFLHISPIPFIDSSLLTILLAFYNKNYGKHQFRKKIQLFNNLMAILNNFIQPTVMNYTYLLQILSLVDSTLFNFKSPLNEHPSTLSLDLLLASQYHHQYKLSLWISTHFSQQYIDEQTITHINQLSLDNFNQNKVLFKLVSIGNQDRYLHLLLDKLSHIKQDMALWTINLAMLLNTIDNIQLVTMITQNTPDILGILSDSVIRIPNSESVLFYQQASRLLTFMVSNCISIRVFIEFLFNYTLGGSTQDSSLLIAYQYFNSIVVAILDTHHNNNHMSVDLDLDLDVDVDGIRLLNHLSIGGYSNRSLVNSTQILTINLTHLLSLTSPQPDSLTSIITEQLSNIIDTCQQFNYSQYLYLIRYLIVIYIPQQSIHPNPTQYLSICKTIFQNILSNNKQSYTYTDIQYFMQFALHPQILTILNTEQSSSEHDMLILSFIQQGNTHWLIQRVLTDRLFLIIHNTPILLTYLPKTLISLLTVKEFRGYDAGLLVYCTVPVLANCRKKLPDSSDIQGVYPRYMMLQLLVILVKSCLDRPQIHIQLEHFLLDLVQKLLDMNLEKTLNNNMQLKYCDSHRKKVYIWNALLVLSPLITVDILSAKTGYLKIFMNTMNKVIQVNNLPTIRQYVDMFSINVISQFPQENLQFLLNVLETHSNLKANYAISLIFISGYLICNLDNSEISKPLFDKLVVYTTSHVAYLRSVAQYFCFEYLQKKQDVKESQPFLIHLYQYLKENKESKQLRKKYQLIIEKYQEMMNNIGNLDLLLTRKYDDYGEILHGSLVEEIKEMNINMIALLKDDEISPPKLEDLWKIESSRLVTSNEEKQESQHFNNFQRKIDNIMEDSQLLSDTLTVRRPVNEDTSMTVVASLLDKVPNLANLTRTLEVFGIHELAINNAKLLEDNEFKNITVTADKWMPIIEVKEENVLQYLLMKKQKGYTIVGLEQTSQSVQIEQYVFPDKVVLVLGKEKLGIPVELIDVLDVAIEIPQFGQIRSLNVHISAVISVWQFVKQKFIK